VAKSRDGSKLKPFPTCCVLQSGLGRLVMLKLLIKVGVSALALMLAALPVAACVLPGAAMTSAERECCKKMAEQCGDMGMAKSHPCCKVTATPTDFHALKTASSQLDHVSLVLFHALPLTAQTDEYFSLSQWSSRVSCAHSPPGLESLATTVLRI
jgi:hypothetical protein